MSSDRDEQLRIQALGAAISRKDWHAVELAHAAIRDEFDRRSARPQYRPATEDEAQRGLNDVWPGDPYPVENQLGPCPECGAPAGMDCRTIQGRVQPHETRCGAEP